MGLLTIIKKQKLKDREIRCLILGLDNSGKSTIVNGLLPESEKCNSITPTVGFQIHSIVVESAQDGKTYKVNLWDIGGQRTLRPFWDNYFDKTDVLLWCVDIASSLRFDESFNELRELVMQDRDRIGYQCKLVVAINKIDLVEQADLEHYAHDIEQKIEHILHHGQSVGESSIGHYFLCSGKTGAGIENLAQMIVDRE